MDLVYRDGKDYNVTSIYKGASADKLTHMVRLQNGTKYDVHDSNLQLLDQLYFSNIPKTPLNFRNEVRHGSSLEEAQALARPRPLSPFRIIFQLADK
eukprot:10060476-Ditylum_brightwellii.AAC.1